MADEYERSSAKQRRSWRLISGVIALSLDLDGSLEEAKPYYDSFGRLDSDWDDRVRDIAVSVQDPERLSESDKRNLLEALKELLDHCICPMCGFPHKVV